MLQTAKRVLAEKLSIKGLDNDPFTTLPDAVSHNGFVCQIENGPAQAPGRQT